MEMRHLHQFIALAEEKQFTAAARRMNVVQSGLSFTIKELEEELGLQLVERSTRHVSLTRAGDLFLEYARMTIATLNDGVQAVRAENGVVRGRLNIGVLQNLHPYVTLPVLLQTFRAKYPDVEFAIRSLSAERIPDLVRSGYLDIGFLPLVGESKWPGVELLPFAHDSLIAISALGGALNKKRRVGLAELSGLPFVDLVPERSLRTLIDQIFVKHHLQRESRYEVSDVQMLLDLVEAGLGIALLPSALAKSAAVSRKLQTTSIASPGQPVPEWRLAVVVRKQRHPLTCGAPLALFLTALYKQSKTAAVT